MHARLIFDGQVLMGADAPPQYYKQPQGFSLSLNVQERTEAERLFNALAEGGNVKMPFQKTFWSTGFGMLIDRFGTPWMVNCEQAAQASITETLEQPRAYKRSLTRNSRIASVNLTRCRRNRDI